MNPLYSNQHSQLADRLLQMAHSHASNVSKYPEKLPGAEAEKTAAEQAFLADPSKANAGAVVEAANRVQNLRCLEDVVQNAGGREEIEKRAQRSRPMFSALEKGFEQRVAELTRHVAPTLKKLGERRAFLSESAMHSMLIERDETVLALRGYHEALVGQIATAEFSRNYCRKQGEGYAHETIPDLYGRLTQPFPTAPTTDA